MHTTSPRATRTIELSLCIFLLSAFAACSPPDQSDEQDMSGADMLAPDMQETVDLTEDLSSTVQDMPADLAQDMQDMAMPDQDMSSDAGDEVTFLTLPPKPWDIRVRGPYRVGYGTGEFTYNVEPGGEARTIEVVYWYPTRVERWKKARYMRGIVGIGEAYDVPPIDDTQATFPMMVFSHGNGSIAEQSFTYTEHFASHGWIVVAPYHTNNTIFDNPSAINYLSSVDRPQDISALLDWTEALPEEESHPIDGHIDRDKILMSGHSFGAFTTMAVAGAQFDVDAVLERCTRGEINQDLCEIFGEEYHELFRKGFTEPRLKAAIPHTPGIGPAFEDGVDQITIPLLMMTAGRDRALPAVENGDYMWDRMRTGPHARFDLPNGGHFTYSNMCELFGGVEQAKNDGCNETFIDSAIALPMINHYALAWAEYHLLGEMRHEALIRGEEQPYPEEDLHYETIADREN